MNDEVNREFSWNKMMLEGNRRDKNLLLEFGRLFGAQFRPGFDILHNLRNVQNHPLLIDGPVFGENGFDFVVFAQLIQRQIAHHHTHFASIQLRFVFRSVH